MRHLVACLSLTLGCTTLAGNAHAQDYGDPSGKSLIATADLRLIGVDGERSWLDGGFGKSRFSPDGGSRDFRIEPRAVEGDVVWMPQLGWSLGATIAAIAQDGQEHPVDLSEAYVSWRRNPHGAFRLSARAGLFWPPVSLEHGGADWSVTDTITPSAINSWIGEEVKVAGGEATGSTAFAGGRLSGSAALFGLNDTAGTLLALRGWALHDEKATAFGHQPLPPLGGFIGLVQAPSTRPVIDLDNRPGFYARIGWSRGDAVRLHLFYYDNCGNPEAVNPSLQWGWRTRFVEAGGKLAIGAHTRLTAQALTGSTQMGYPLGADGRLWVNTHFDSAFALLSHDLGKTTLSGRIEAFGTEGRGSVVDAEYSERGWAATVAAKRPIGDHLTVLAEALHIRSDRDQRGDAGGAPQQDQTIVQLALRLHS